MENKYLIKIAKAAPDKKLRVDKHHQEVFDLLEKGDGVVAQHSMGSGKTLNALRAAAIAQKRHPDKDVIISAPASVIKQFESEREKFGIKLDSKHTKYYSHEELVNRAEAISKGRNSLLIIDEAHRLRNTGTAKYKAHALVRDSADKAVLYTGTAMYKIGRASCRERV